MHSIITSVISLRSWAKAVGILMLLGLSGCIVNVTAAERVTGINGNLVSVEWLQKNLGKPDVLVLDASPMPMHMAKHIATAVPVDFFAYGAPNTPLAGMEQHFQSWGISPGKKIVLYDQGGTWYATRLFFSLVYHHFPDANLYVLDGGLSKWEAQGFPVNKEATPAPAKGTFKVSKTNEALRVRLPEFLTASGDVANNVLLETLGADWHFGEVLSFGRAGHIPRAIMMPSDDFFNPDKTFKSVGDIQRQLRYLGIRGDQTIHNHCGGGGAASVSFFALKYMLNHSKATLYVESQMGWLSDPRDLPYWTYDAPYLMRNADWLKSWGGRMLRMIGMAQLSVVDVRSADEFNSGHIPFALNIPAEVFKGNLADLNKLAKTLGHAGVNAAHEAVIVSGGGLTRESALAFVMLEKLGQKKISVLMEAADKWVQLGFVVTAEKTLVGTGKSPMDMAIPPSIYPENFRQDIIIANPGSSKGLFPKVFIASGKNVPAKAPDGKIVHVPYTALLNADGTPKAAKDIWNILAKAGVPRYAELISFAEDPGEAAINYFILKLMGYPDIKMLAI